MSLRSAVAALACSGLLACAGGTPRVDSKPAAPAVPAGVDARVWNDVRWLPSGLESIVEFQHADRFSPVLSWIAQLVARLEVPCTTALVGKVERSLQIHGAWGAANVFIG